MKRGFALAWELILMLALMFGAACGRSNDGKRAVDQGVGPPQPAKTQADSFPSLMDASMSRMHAGMAVAASGDADRDFAAMMIPHHQGAVDMAEIELRFGHDQRLRRLAQGIIVEQRQEIMVMQEILAGLPTATASPESTSSSTVASDPK